MTKTHKPFDSKARGTLGSFAAIDRTTDMKEEIEIYIERQLKHCVDWKGDSSSYDKVLLAEVLDDVMQYIREDRESYAEQIAAEKIKNLKKNQHKKI